MKKLLCVALCALVGSACAETVNLNAKSPTGFYVGAQAGYAESTYKKNDIADTTKLDKSGFAGRIKAGYLFTPHFAVEIGGTYIPNVKWAISQPEPLNNLELKQRYLLDVFAKGILPLKNNFSVFGKAGLAWYHQEWQIDPKNTDSAVIPALGVGMSYHINSQLSADVDYTYYLKKGNAEEIERDDNKGHYFSGMHFIGVGLTYCFGA